MSPTQALSLALLVVVLVLAIWQRLNIGMLALAAALPILVFSGASVDKMYDAFPGNLFVLIAGVSLLFAHVERSGALAFVVKGTYAAVGDRHWLLPWAGFALAGAMSTAGAFSTAPIAFLVPMIAYVSVGYSGIFYLCELAVVIGANSSGLSPLNPTGALVRTIADKYHVTYSGWGLWAVSLVVAIIVVFAMQMIDAVYKRRGRAFVVTPAPAEQTHVPNEGNEPAEQTRDRNEGNEPAEQTRDRNEGNKPAEQTHVRNEGNNRIYMWCSGLALIAFVLLVLFPKTDVGITAVAMAVLLQVFFRPFEKLLLSRIPWNSILLLCGLLTYLGLMQEIGTMTSIQKALNYLGTGALLILVLSYMTVLLCNIESSTLGVLGLIMPLVFATYGTSTQTFWIVAAVAVPAALMVMSPIHVAGTLIIANSATKDQDRLFRRLLGTAVSLAAVVPAVMVLVPISMV